jgi:hypothetical protein
VVNGKIVAAGYGHKNQPQSIDLNAVRLCFQVFLTDDSYKVQRTLQPVVSEVVYDKKAMSDLLIVRSSHCSGPVRGGTTVILLCEKVNYLLFLYYIQQHIRLYTLDLATLLFQGH